MKRIVLGFLAGAALVLSSGLMLPAHASITDLGIDSPADGATVRSRTVPVQMHAKSDGNGIARMRLDLSGPHFASQRVWCYPVDSSGNCTSGNQAEYTKTFNWDTTSLTQYNGEYTLTLTVVEVNNQTATNQQSHTVEVATPPATPRWNSITGSNSGGEHVTLRWAANSEPDITQYRIDRPAQNGQASTGYTIDASNPGAQGCSLSGGEFRCTDSRFSSTGYGGDYTYYLTAYRSSPSDPGGVNSNQSAQSASLSEPAAGNTGGSGGPGGASSSGNGNAAGSGTGGAAGNDPGNGGFIPNGGLGASLTPDPAAVNPQDFYTGPFKPTLPYGVRKGVSRGTISNPQAAASFGDDIRPPLNARKLLLPLAGGLFAIIAALHFRRVLRDA